MSQEDLQALARSGALQASDLVWTQGMETWIPAGSVQCLGPFAAPEPPPIPGAAPPVAAQSDPRLKAARLHLAQGRFEEAVALASAVIGLDGKEAAAYLLRAEAHRRLRRTERALADLAVAIRLAPDRPEPYLVRASILKKQLRFDQAIADATQALILNPALTAAYALRSECRRLIGDEHGARHDAEELIRLDPTHPLGSRLQAPSESLARPPFSLEEELLDPGVPVRQSDGSDLFADGRPAERSLKLRRPVRSSRSATDPDSDAERLADAVDYRPEVMTAPLPRIRPRPRRDSARWTPALVLLLAGLTGVLWLQNSRPPQPSPPSMPARVAPARVPVAAAVPKPGAPAPPVATPPVPPAPAPLPVSRAPEPVLASGGRAEPAEEGRARLPGTRSLFNGKNLDGWSVFFRNGSAQAQDEFVVSSAGLLAIMGRQESYIRTNESFEDFVLTFEWRFPPGGRQSGSGSGLLLALDAIEQGWQQQGCEVQIAAGRSGELFANDRWGFHGQERRGRFGYVARRADAERPIGEWNTYEIRCEGPKITVTLNGQLVNEATRQRAIAGRLGFMSQGAEVEFRELWLTPLEH